MTRPTLDQRIEAARKQADAKHLDDMFNTIDNRGHILGAQWLRDFVDALGASAERGDAETRIAELERERDEARRIVEAVAEAAGFAKTFDPSLVAGKVTALTASVSAAKRDVLEECARWVREHYEGGKGAPILAFREEHYPPAPATPPERVSVTVGDATVCVVMGEYCVSYKNSGAAFQHVDAEMVLRDIRHVTDHVATASEYAALLALAGGAE